MPNNYINDDGTETKKTDNTFTDTREVVVGDDEMKTAQTSSY